MDFLQLAVFVLAVSLEVLMQELSEHILVVLLIVKVVLLVEPLSLAQTVLLPMSNLDQLVFNVMLIVKIYNVLVMEMDSVIINYVKQDLE
jgi:hypothetical protein